MAHGSIGLNQQLAENKRAALKKQKAVSSAERCIYLSYMANYENEYGQPLIDYTLIEPANPHLANK